MTLIVSKRDGETWRECVERVAKKWFMDAECLEEFDKLIKSGVDEAQAAWEALYEWDCLDYVEDDNAKRKA